jgi:hypothetical protein
MSCLPFVAGCRSAESRPVSKKKTCHRFQIPLGVSFYNIFVANAFISHNKPHKQCTLSQFSLKNLTPWRDSNPGLLFFRLMRRQGYHYYVGSWLNSAGVHYKKLYYCLFFNWRVLVSNYIFLITWPHQSAFLWFLERFLSKGKKSLFRFSPNQ